MKIEQLRYFIAAGQAESVTRAGKSLGISASAISHAISALESELGQELFVRDRQRVYLTAHGKVLLSRASRLLEDWRQLQADLSSPEIPFAGHYQIATTRGLAETVGGALAKLQSKYTKLSVRVSTLRSSEIVRMLAANELDLGICVDPGENHLVESESIGTDHYAIAVAKDHPLAKAPHREALRQIANFPACMHPPREGFGDFELHPALVKLKIHPRVTFIYDSYDLVVPRLAMSEAWALLPKRLLQKDSPNLRFIDLNVREAALTIAAARPTNKPLAPPLASLVEALA